MTSIQAKITSVTKTTAKVANTRPIIIKSSYSAYHTKYLIPIRLHESQLQMGEQKHNNVANGGGSLALVRRQYGIGIGLLCQFAQVEKYCWKMSLCLRNLFANSWHNRILPAIWLLTLLCWFWADSFMLSDTPLGCTQMWRWDNRNSKYMTFAISLGGVTAF